MPRPARIVAFGLGLAGAVCLSQGPEYAQQYRQRLGGAIDELRTIVSRFDADARAVGESREGALGRLAANADELARRQGLSMHAAARRLEGLEAQRRRMDEAGAFGRLVVLMREGDPGIARGALEVFEPAVPVTWEGAASGAAGFAGGWALAFGTVAGLGRWWRALRRRPVRAEAA